VELKQGFKEPIRCYEFWPFVGGPNHIDCTKCGLANIIGSSEPKPFTRLSSPNCMNCGERLTCPDCKHDLYQGMVTERDAILICDNKNCNFICSIW